MKLTQLIAVAALVAAPAAAGEPRERPQKPARVKSSCIGDRCAIYVNGYRSGSVTRDSDRQVTVRDRNGRVVARVRAD